MAGSLDGKVALVTGASSGIGRGTALCLAEAGATVAVSARRKERLDELVAEIEASGGKAIALPGDVSIEEQAIAAVEETVKQLGRVDILINSAGVIQFGGLEALPAEEWKRVMDVNLMGTLYCCKAAIAPMKAQGSGHIINISSTSGRRAAAIFGAYSTSKFAVNGFTEGLRQELGDAGIRVGIIEPGATESEVASGISDPTMKAAMTEHVNKDGAMKARDIGDTVVFMASLPPRANVSEILIQPTIDTDPN